MEPGSTIQSSLTHLYLTIKARNYVVSKSSIFDPLPLVVFLLSRVYVM